jgi:hypothetical protein
VMDRLVLSDAAWERMAPLIIGRLAIVWAGLPEIKDKSRLSYPALLASLGSLLRNEPSLRAACITGFLMFAAFSAMWSTLATLLAKPPYGFGSDTVGAFGFLGIAGLLALWAPVHCAAGFDLEMNFGTVSLAAPHAASSSVSRYSRTDRRVRASASQS